MSSLYQRFGVKVSLSPIFIFIFLAASTSGLSAELALSFQHPAFALAKHGDTLRFECSALPLINVSDVRVSGACSGNPTVSFSESVKVPTDPKREGYKSLMHCKFSAIDACQNLGELAVYIMIVDHTPPLLQDVPLDVVLTVGSKLPPVNAVYAIDNCSRNLKVIYTADSTGAGVARVHTRRWETQDEAGNVASAQQLVTFQAGPATSPPCGASIFLGLPARMSTLSCEAGEKICLQIRPGTQLQLNGKLLEPLKPCGASTKIAYDLNLARSLKGSMVEVIWRVSPGAYRGRLTSLESLLGFLQDSSPEGRWQLGGDGKLLGEVSSRYGKLTLIAVGTGQQVELVAEEVQVAIGYEASLNLGKNNLVATNETCRDSTVVELVCIPSISREITILKGIGGAFCFPGNAPADTYTLEEIVAAEEKVLGKVTASGVCLEFKGLTVGRTRASYLRCHTPTGQCERYEIDFYVISSEQVKPPSPQNDYVAVAYNGQQMVEVLLNDELIGPVKSLVLRGTVQGAVRVDPRNRVHYAAPKDWCGVETFSYIVCTDGGCKEAEVKIEVGCERLIVFSGFSPNQDGANDYLTVLGIENYPDNKLIVFNQHGHEVYTKTGYTNDWEGHSHGTPLSDGTYYYVLTVEGFDMMSGYIQIAR